jgi:hypothetical protein
MQLAPLHRGAIDSGVHEHCFVRDSAHHSTLFFLKGLTPSEAARVALSSPPSALPLEVGLYTWNAVYP